MMENANGVGDLSFSEDERKSLDFTLRKLKHSSLTNICLIGVFAVLAPFFSFGEAGDSETDLMFMVVALAVISVIDLLIGFFLRKVLLRKALSKPLTDSELMAVSETGKYYIGRCVIGYALGMAVCFFGVILLVLGANLSIFYVFSLGGLAFIWMMKHSRAELEHYAMVQKGFFRGAST